MTNPSEAMYVIVDHNKDRKPVAYFERLEDTANALQIVSYQYTGSYYVITGAGHPLGYGLPVPMGKYK